MDSNEKKNGHGGAREGAGRPRTSPDSITIKGLLEQVKKQTGRDYEEVLIEDFIDARDRKDSSTVVKYHNLILNKVMNSLARIEVTDSKDAIEAKQAAFAEALARFAGIEKE